MTELYSAGILAGHRKKWMLCRTLAVCAISTAAVCCAALCCLTTTGNAIKMQWLAVGIFTLGGWVMILLTALGIRPAKHLYAHEKSILNGAGKPFSGVLIRLNPPFQIPGSILIRKVCFENGDGSFTLRIPADRARLLPPAGTPVRGESVRDYILRIETDGDHP